MKTLAKSLHTVTVLVRVAELHQNLVAPGAKNYGLAMSRTLETLGYTGAPDPYDLVGKALAQLEAE